MFFKKEEEQRTYLKDYEGYNSRQMAKMTHVEIFHFPVTEPVVTWKDSQGCYPVLFDYQRRDPLTGDAVHYVLQPEDF